jgi:RHS repeat-associated protein
LHEFKTFTTKDALTDNVITWLFEEDSFSPIAKIKNDKYYSIINDHLGKPYESYDDKGDLVWSRELNSNGKVLKETGIQNFCPFLYQGQSYDAEIELTYNRFRYYDPNDGKYISQDPIGLQSGEYSFYNYVHDTNIWNDIFGLVGGGSYSQVRTSNIGGEVHHMPANSINGLGHGSGPAIHMTSADHTQTASHGHQGIQGKAYRKQQKNHINNGRFDKAMKMDIIDIKAKTKSGAIKNDYSQSMGEAVDRALKKKLITDAQHRRLKKLAYSK